MKKPTASGSTLTPPAAYISQATTSKSKSTKSIPRTEENEAFVVIPPDGGWGWVVVFAAFYAYVISDGTIFSFGLLLDDIAVSLKCPKSQVSLAAAIQTCFYCLAGPFAAALVNRFGYRTVTIMGCLLGSVACALTSISTEIYQVIIAYGVIGGVGFGMVYVSAIIVVGYYFERWRALASGISLCGAGFGGTALPPILNLLLKHLAWRNTFRVIALMILSCTLCGVVFKPIKPVKVKVEADGNAKRTLSHISEIQETKSKVSQFFIQYNNAMYPTVADVTSSVIALLRPPKLTMTRSASSEIMTTTLICDTEYVCAKGRDGTSKRCSSCCYLCCFCCMPKRGTKIPRETRASSYKTVEMPSRPLYRDDIFYAGSIMTLPEYKRSVASRPAESVKSKSVLEYHISVTRTITHQDIEDQTKCTICPDAVKRTLATMLDVRLLKSPSFNMLTFNAVCTAYAFYTPFVYITDRAIQNGISPEIAFWLISAIGVMNTIGRILCGIISSFPKVKANALCAAWLFIGGVATILSGMSFEVWAQFLYAGVYGLSVSSISTLRSVIIVDILGLEKLTNAVGMILLFQGVATLAGTALSGMLRDMTGSYHISFYVAGAAIVLGSLFLIPMKKKTATKDKPPENRTSRV